MASRRTSADNALLLVRLLARHGSLRVSDAASLLGVAPATAYRLLASLRGQGFAVQEARNGRYRPGPVLRELGTAALSPKDVRHEARPVLERLTAETGETVSLGVLDERDVRFVDGIEGRRTVRVGNRIGVRIPAHCTAAGKAMLAALPPVEVERRYADRELERRTAHSAADWQELGRALDAVRRAGYAMNVEEGEVGVCAVGAAVVDASGAPVAAVNVVLPAGRMPDGPTGREFSGRIVEAAAEVTAALHSR